METLLVFITLLAALSAKNLPSPEYVPTKEQLEMIFGADASIPSKTAAVETPAVVPEENERVKENVKLCQKINEIFGSVTTETVELNIKIKMNDCEKRAHQNVTEKPVEGDPGMHTRFVENAGLTDDRVSFGGDKCPSPMVRVGNQCVKPD